VRSGKNTIIKAARYEESRQVRAPKKGKREKKGKGERKEECEECHPRRLPVAHVLTLKNRFVAAVVERHLDCGRRCQFRRELATGIDSNGQKRKRPVIQCARAGDDSVVIVVGSY